MIILDLQQVMIANFMSQVGNHTNIEMDEGLLRHMILNTIRANNLKFRGDFGELIIASDGRNGWRKNIFPYYKYKRREARSKSDIDWNSLFTILNKIRDEIRDNFPYRVINIEGAEADDIIGTLAHTYGKVIGGEPILILSGDKDFIQLQKFGNVKQYDPVRKRWIKNGNPESYLKEHIIRGDAGDGIPNFLSDDNSIATGTRQKNIMKKKLAEWLNELNKKEPKEVFNEQQLRNFERNKQLIDLTFTPNDIKDSIMKEFESQQGKNRNKLFNYFIQNKLKHLHESIGDF